MRGLNHRDVVRSYVMIVPLRWLSAAGYLVIQAIVLLRSSGLARIIAAVPLAVMVPIFVLTIYGAVRQSNLWPLLLLLASPVALLYVVVVAVLIRPRPRAHPRGFPLDFRPHDSDTKSN
jgi:hypothetical protein